MREPSHAFDGRHPRSQGDALGAPDSSAPVSSGSFARGARSREGRNVRLVAELARGGMGHVHLAVATGMGGFSKLLVVKELRPDLACDDGYVTMFLEEARLAARLTHPNIVQTYEVCSDGNAHSIIMEYLDGRSLERVSRRVAAQGGLPLGASLQILSDVLRALDYAHGLKGFAGEPLHVVHRDISPPNIFVTFDGQTKVIDFGIAKAADSMIETQSGILKGRVAYMAPEQARGEKVDWRGDLYSVGVMIWEAVARRRLRPQTSHVELLMGMLAETPPLLRSVAPHAPVELEELCARALSPRPEDRYGTAAEMLTNLEAYRRSCRDAMTMRDVGALVSRAFESERRRMAAVLEEALARPSSVPVSSLLLLTPSQGVPAGGGTLPPSSGVRPHVASSADDRPSLEPAPAGQRLEPGPVPLAPPTTPHPDLADRRWVTAARWGLGLALALLLAAVTFTASSRKVDPSSTPPLAPASVAPIPLAPPPTAAPPEMVDVFVRVSPLNAVVSLDSLRLPRNPFSGRLPRDAEAHRIVAMADGYEPKSLDVALTGDLQVEISLDRRARPPMFRPSIPVAATVAGAPSARHEGSTVPRRATAADSP